MADFQPKFFDLVRNYTTSVGTADFVLGPAVNGYAGFTETLQVGDSFYYSVLGVDKPAEHEVGRGTLLDKGIVSRDPIGGAKTNFSSGTKSIAVIAAAEWFNSMQAGAGARSSVASRVALASAPSGGVPILAERGREGLFAFDTSDLSAHVAADSNQGLYVAPASDPTGSAGAWVRRFSGPLNAAWFGLVEGDDPANAGANSAAFSAMLAVLAKRRKTYAASNSNAIERVHIPYGIYWFGDAGAGAAIELTSAVMIEGHNGGFTTDCAPMLKFTAGVTGIRVQGPLTSGADSKDAAAHSGASGTVLRNLSLKGGFAGSEGEAHGIQLRSAATIDNVSVTNFEGDGICISASLGAASGASPPYGNDNSSFLNRVTATACRNGIFIDGQDANACTIVMPNCSSNRQWGIWDSSFLGNSYSGGHLATNGVGSANDGVTIGASIVSFNGNRYFAIAGQESGASSNPPSGDSSDNAYWAYLGAGAPASGRPAWTSGMLVRAGGALYDDNASSNGHYAGVYAEQDQGKAQVVQQSLVSGGYLAKWLFLNPAANRCGSYLKPTTGGKVEIGTSIESPGSITSSGGAIGYANGAGGAVTQLTAKTTAVTVDALSGQITMNNAAMTNASAQNFQVNNSQVDSTDTIILNLQGGAAGATAYRYWVCTVGAGFFKIAVENRSGGPLSEALVFNFAVIRAVNA